MTIISLGTTNASAVERLRSFFTTRDIILHDGRDLRRLSVSGRTQALMASVAAVTVVFSAYGLAQAGADAVIATGLFGDQSAEAKVSRMRAEMKAMESEVAALKIATQAHAARVEQRQALISAAMTGKTAPATLDLPAPVEMQKTSAMTDDVVAPLRRVEARQLSFAIKARQAVEARYSATTTQLRRLGISTRQLVPAMGGPYEPVEGDATTTAAVDSDADAQFRSLFLTWKKLDTLEQAVISIPSLQPVENLTLTSTFGVRSDPFRGTAAMHAGIDIPGAVGTPIYATADGIVSRAQRAGGYGNLVEINHGKGIETRYGHLSRILVAPNTRVRRGQMIGLMGSTGRSTGSHLHYEVRIEGRAVNPVPYLQTTDYLLAIQDRALRSRATAVGGPAGAQK